MKTTILTIIAGLIFMLSLFQIAEAQKLSAKKTSLINYLVKEANQPDYHSADDKYLRVTIGNTDYMAELKSGKIVSQTKAENASGGFSGVYAEVQIYLLNQNKNVTSQGAGVILKMTGMKWKEIARNETDYQCVDIKSIPKVTLKALRVECN